MSSQDDLLFSINESKSFKFQNQHFGKIKNKAWNLIEKKYKFNAFLSPYN